MDRGRRAIELLDRGALFGVVVGGGRGNDDCRPRRFSDRARFRHIGNGRFFVETLDLGDFSGNQLAPTHGVTSRKGMTRCDASIPGKTL